MFRSLSVVALGILLFPVPGSALPITDFSVPGRLPLGQGPFPPTSIAWQDTQAQVGVGDTVRLTAVGAFAANDFFDPGISPEGTGQPGSSDFLAPGISRFALVGKIGVFGDPFFIGSDFEDVSTASGTLFLGINDEFFADNLGEFTVSGSVTPVPEPSTAALLLFGLILFTQTRPRAV